MKPPLPLPGSEDSLSPVVAGVRRVFCCHRALFSGNLPPNSLAAVQDCVEAGAPRLEVDVRFLADDSLLVMHDRALALATGTLERVDGLDRASLLERCSMSVENMFPCFLEDVVEVVRSSGTVLQVDLKLMRTLTPARIARLVGTLAPLGEKVLIGSQAHWNLRRLAAQGLPVAFDPTLQWHCFPERTGEGLSPARIGLHGLWDDATIAHIPTITAGDYIDARVADLLGLIPEAREWMVDSRTLLHMASLGFRLGEMLGQRGVELAAWTVRDEGRAASTATLYSLFELGTKTIITDHPLALAGYARELQADMPVEPRVAV